MRHRYVPVLAPARYPARATPDLSLGSRFISKRESILKERGGNLPAKMPYLIDVDQYGYSEIMGQDARQMILTPSLCRAARGLLDWTQTDLAEHAEVSRSTVRDYEGCRHDVHRATAVQLRRAFEDKGVVFLEVEGYGLGVFGKAEPAKDGSDRPASDT